MIKRTFLAIALLSATFQAQAAENSTPEAAAPTVFEKVQSFFAAAVAAPQVAFNELTQETMFIDASHALTTAKDSVVTGFNIAASAVTTAPTSAATYIVNNKYSVVTAAVLVAAAGYAYKSATAKKTAKN